MEIGQNSDNVVVSMLEGMRIYSDTCRVKKTFRGRHCDHENDVDPIGRIRHPI